MRRRLSRARGMAHERPPELELRDPADPRRHQPRPDHRRPRAADLRDHRLPVPRHPARRRPVRAGRARQHLHADHEPDAGRARAARGVPGGWCRGAGGRLRPGRRRRSRSSTWPRPATTSSRPRRCTAAPTTCCTTRCRSSGITVSFVEDPDDAEAWQALVQDNTKAFFAETIGNPKGDILDIETVAGVAHRNGVPLIVDNTIATPYLIRPFEFGADIVVHSATKYLGGHGTVIAGLIVDGGDVRLDQRQVPRLHHAGPDATTASSTPRSALRPSRSRPGCSCCATSARRSRRSTRSSSSRGSRRCRCAWSGTSPTPSGWRSTSRATTRSTRWTTRACRPRRWHAAQQKYAPQGRRRGARLRAARRRRGRQEVRRGPRAAQPRGQHRRRPQPGDPPGVDDALAAHPRGAGHRPASRPAWCAWPWAWRASRTSSPTSRPGSAPPRAPEMGGWVEGDPAGDRRFLDLPGTFRPERGGLLPGGAGRVRDVGNARRGRRQRRPRRARAHRRQPRRRPARPRAPDRRLVGRADRARAGRWTPTASSSSAPTCWAAARGRPAPHPRPRTTAPGGPASRR